MPESKPPQQDDSTADAWANARVPRRVPLHWKIVIGLLIGATVGLTTNILVNRGSAASESSGPKAGEKSTDNQAASSTVAADAPTPAKQWLDTIVTNVTDPIGRIFLRLVLMVVVPLVFSALALGVLELGDVRRLGRIGLRTLLLTGLLSLSAVLIGVVLVNLVKPGAVLTADERSRLEERYASRAADAVSKAESAKPLRDMLLDIIPENPLQEMVGALDGSSKGNGMLAVMFFALAFGIALSTVAPERAATMIRWLEGLFDVCMAIIGFAMRLAPVAVACLIFSLTSQLGIGILRTLAWFVITALGGMAIHLVIVYPLVIRIIGGRSPLQFFRDVSEAMITAFGTSSSNATLPTALRVAQENLRVPREVSQFVLTIGATGNQNGTALFEGVVVLFLAQLFGKDLTLGQQASVVLMSILAGIGTAGVPGGSLPLIVLVLQSVGIPGEGIGVVLGVDRVLDMCRTTLNVTGDLAIAACVARGEPASEPLPA